MRILITGWYHKKNLHGLLTAIDLLGWTMVQTLDEAEVVMSGSEYIDTKLYPSKKFIFGPHFSNIPDQRCFNLGKSKNVVYIQPSLQAAMIWANDYHANSYLNLVSYAFGVDTNKFSPHDCVKENVFVYYKNRDPSELTIICNFLRKRDIEYTLIQYGSYSEEEYINLLDRSSYGIWLGSHESQGFALEEALSMNVPLLVWSTRSMSQEYGCGQNYSNIPGIMTSVPYWSNKCGEVFFDECNLENTFDLFKSKLHDYRPREYIVQNLSMKARADGLKQLVESMG